MKNNGQNYILLSYIGSNLKATKLLAPDKRGNKRALKSARCHSLVTLQ